MRWSGVHTRCLALLGLSLLITLGLAVPPSEAITITGSSRIQVRDETVLVGSFGVLNCQGAGITCENVGGVLDISVSGVGAGSLADPGGNGLVNRTGTGVTSPYAGTSCTNQVLRALTPAGVGSCTSITSAYVDSSICKAGEAGSCAGYQASLGFTAENVANKSTDTTLGVSPSNILYPSQLAVKTYVDTIAATKQNTVTWGVGLAASGATARTALEEAGAVTNGDSTDLTAGAAQGGKMQIMASGALQYTGYEVTPLLHSGYLAPINWNLVTTTCTNDPQGGKVTVSGGLLMCAADAGSTASASGSATWVQYSAGSGVFAAEAAFAYNATTDVLSVPGRGMARESRTP